ncbi:MAG: 30S ribosomal protein S17 [Nanoarchaeota archaeon]|nr:30S ribosomal protein S17 [Nanoarchaeota archaeon]
MAKEKVTKKIVRKVVSKAKKAPIGAVKCNDRLCPKHGREKIRTRGRTFEGNVIRKHHGRVTIEFERMIKVPKYERYEKRKTKLHARLTDCMAEKVKIGDLIQIAETRPISKMIHFIVVGVKDQEASI